jgi:hypothetical protein
MLKTISAIISSVLTAYNNYKISTCTIQNTYATGYQTATVTIIAPYGCICLPNASSQALVTQLNGSSKAMIIQGFINQLPVNSPINIVEGEFAYASDNWALVYNNDGLRANKLDNADFLATLPNGEFIGQMIQDLINDNNNVIRGWLNEHVHSNGNGGANTGIPTITIDTSTILTNDNTYIENENYLLNNDGTMYP